MERKTVLATKVYGRMGDGPNDRRLSAYNIRRASEESLRRLQTDHIDRETPWEEIWQAMEQLVREGKVIYVGSSNFAGWHIAQAQCAAAGWHFMGLGPTHVEVGAAVVFGVPVDVPMIVWLARGQGWSNASAARVQQSRLQSAPTKYKHANSVGCKLRAGGCDEGPGTACPECGTAC